LLTTLQNSFVNACYMRMAWIEMCMEAVSNCPLPGMGNLDMEQLSELITMKSFGENVTEAYFGDDDIGETSPKARWFNMRNIAVVLGRHGLTYTTNEKNGEMVEFFKLSEARYLKRRFVPDSEYPELITLAPMDPAPVRELINWYKDCESPREALNSNITDFQQFYSHFPEHCYEEEVGKVMKACRDRGFYPQFWSWNDFRNALFVRYGLFSRD